MPQPDQQNNALEVNNISDCLKFFARVTPDKHALLYPEKITYRELEKKVNACSYGLDHAGIRAGALSLVMVAAGTDFFILTFALLRIGAVPVMIDPGMGTRAMLSVLSGLESEAFIGTSKAHLLPLAFPHVFKKTRILITTGAFRFGRVKRFKNLLTDTHTEYPVYQNDPEEIAAIFFTSGSTGPAKGVIYTTKMLKSQIEITKTLFNIGSDEIDLCTFPLLGLFALCHGNSSVIADMDMMHPAKMDPEKVIRNIRDFRCTQMFGSPMVLNKLAGFGLQKKIKLPSLRKIISAGAPVHRTVLESFGRLVPDNAKIHTPYGATEALPVTDVTAPELDQIYSDKPEYEYGICIGRPVEPLKVEIVEITENPLVSWDDVKPIPGNEVGEIVVKGPWVTRSYFKRDDENSLSKIQDPLTNESWHRMGDLGKIDKHGRLWFYGRKSQRVITADQTLYTIPCEAVFNQHPGVSSSALVGVKTEKPGIMKPVICIKLKSGFHVSKKIIRELQELGNSAVITKAISNILFKKEFPVDPRHNAKIFREKLALWASKRIR